MITAGQATRVETSLRSVRAVAMDRITDTDGRNSIRTVRAEAQIETGEIDTGRIGGQVETTESGKGMGVVAETMGIHLTSYTSMTDIGADKMPTAIEVGWRKRGFLGEERDK